ncbi:MAG: CoA pyrophosphatase [Acidobacteriota bacterium]|nr:CoA pyrophosphatase [Acidobacteriota bacterium]
MLTTTPGRSMPAQLDLLKDYEPRFLPVGDLSGSAVLIPITRGEKPTLLYTLRSRHLKHHPGQVSFPGGRIEPRESGWDAAVREAHEEIGLAPDSVSQLGRIDDVYSPRGFHVACYVGICDPFEPQINEHEVERLVEVDLEELFDGSIHEVKPWGTRHQVHYFHFRDGLVWGVTGEITHILRRILTTDRQ